MNEVDSEISNVGIHHLISLNSGGGSLNTNLSLLALNCHRLLHQSINIGRTSVLINFYKNKKGSKF